MKLRQYQLDAINSCRARINRGAKSILICLPTGAGKTILTAFMLAGAQKTGNRYWFTVPKIELLRQSIDAFNAVGVEHGVIAAKDSGFKSDDSKLVQIASIQTLIRNHKKFEPPKLIVFDEAVSIAAVTWDRLYNAYPDAIKIGLSACPQRTDGRGLGKYFGEMIRGPSVKDLIASGSLSDFKMFAPPGIDLRGVRTIMGDYNASQAANAASAPTITGNIIKEHKKHADGKRTIVFCCTIAHSKSVANIFSECGIVAEHVDGNTPAKQRQASVNRFASGETRVLVNCDLFCYGFDVPAVECVTLLRPTKSLSLYLQMIGRGLRPHPGKSHAIIIDHAGNCEQHGFPDDEHNWSLQGKVKASAIRGPRICRVCYFANEPNALRCQACGVMLTNPNATPRKLPKKVGGDLEEIQRRLIRKSETSNATTLQDLVELGVARGYQYPKQWALKLWNARRGIATSYKKFK